MNYYGKKLTGADFTYIVIITIGFIWEIYLSIPNVAEHVRLNQNELLTTMLGYCIIAILLGNSLYTKLKRNSLIYATFIVNILTIILPIGTIVLHFTVVMLYFYYIYMLLSGKIINQKRTNDTNE